MIKTPLTDLLGIDFPILQGGMAWISESQLSAAVSNAGGAGIIASGGRAPEWVEAEIKKARSLTDKPFGVNVVLQDDNKDAVVEILCAQRVAFVTLGAGNPVPYMSKLKAAGIKVIPVVPSVRLAKRVQEHGADALVIEGMEAGGHIGNQTTMALLTNVIPEIHIPVVAAGGIADGRGIAAALLMGAAGVQMGSRFLLARECKIHPKAQQRILEATDTDSTVTGFSRGHGVRGLKNAFTEKYLTLERAGKPMEELNQLAKGTSRLAAIEGDVENGLIQVGQSLHGLREIQPVQEIMTALKEETKSCLRKAQEWVSLI